MSVESKSISISYLLQLYLFITLVAFSIYEMHWCTFIFLCKWVAAKW